MHISPIPEIIADIKAGKMVVITDAEDRENEGDIIMAAQFVTPQAINFMIKHARGLVCLPMEDTLVEKLGLPMMTQQNGTQYGTNFTVSIEAAHGTTTGISAADRALTIQTAVSPNVQPGDIVQPGHIFPLRAQKGGVLVRAGHTEATVDLAHLAGLTGAGVCCEILNDDGTMARMPELLEFAETHGLKIGTIADLIEYRSRTESLLEEMGDTVVNTPWGTFRQHAFGLGEGQPRNRRRNAGARARTVQRDGFYPVRPEPHMEPAGRSATHSGGGSGRADSAAPHGRRRRTAGTHVAEEQFPSQKMGPENVWHRRADSGRAEREQNARAG